MDRNSLLRATLASGLALGLAAPAGAQTMDDVQQEAVQLYGNAKQYAGQAWRSLFPEKVEICIAYGTEKETWLKQEVERFTKNPANKNLTIKLVPVGSVAGADAIEKNGGRVGSGGTGCTMTAWSPASAAYRDYVLQRTFRAMSLGGAQPAGIATANDLLAAQAPSLVRIPLVFVVWQDTYIRVLDGAKKPEGGTPDPAAAFSFANLTKVEQAGTGGSYTTFFTTNPDESNSGFSTVLLMAYEYGGAGRTGPDATFVSPRNAAFWDKVRAFYTAPDGKSLNNWRVGSTGTLFRDNFLLNGPASDYSGVVTYENLAIQYADTALKQHGQSYRVVYPARSVMSDNPYYVLNATYDAATKKTVMLPEKEKKAAIAFMQFLLEPEQQRAALALGFRPGNLQAGIDISAPDSPFIRQKEIGVQTAPAGVRFVSTNNVGETVIGNLLAGWKAVEATLK